MSPKVLYKILLSSNNNKHFRSSLGIAFDEKERLLYLSLTYIVAAAALEFFLWNQIVASRTFVLSKPVIFQTTNQPYDMQHIFWISQHFGMKNPNPWSNVSTKSRSEPNFIFKWIMKNFQNENQYNDKHLQNMICIYVVRCTLYVYMYYMYIEIMLYSVCWMAPYAFWPSKTFRNIHLQILNCSFTFVCSIICRQR